MTSTDLAKVPETHPVNTATMSDGEIDRLFRIAKGLALSGAFKDVRQAEQAFAKILVGRDLGLSPAQSLSAMDFVKGNIQLRAVTLAGFVKRNPKYDYRITEHTAEKCSILFRERIDGEWQDAGTSTFTIEQAQAAKLVKPDSAWQSWPENMLFARAMSNGVKWFAPDMMGGIPVYTEGDDFREAVDLTAGDSTGADAQLAPGVEAVVKRAEELGHRGLANRGAAAMATNGQSDAVLARWIQDAMANLDLFEDQQPEPKPDPPDAEVVPDPAKPTEEEQRIADELGVPIVSQGFLDDGPPRKAEPREQTTQAQELRERATELQEDAEGFAESDPELAQELRDKADELRAEADAMDDGAQGELL